MHNYEIPRITLGSGSLYIKDEYLANTLPDVTFPDNDIPEYVSSINRVSSADAECSFEAEINAPLFNKLCGIDLSNAPDCTNYTVVYSEPYQEQRRKHKKKRINKKWAKRYGYVTKFRKWRITEVSFVGHDKLEFEILGKGIELLKR